MLSEDLEAGPPPRSSQKTRRAQVCTSLYQPTDP